MNDWRYDRSNRHDVVTIPLVWLAFVLSLLVHFAALWFWLPRMHDLSAANAETDKASAALAVQLEAQPNARESSPPTRPSPPPTLAQTAPRPRAAPPRTPAKQRPTPPVIAQNKQESEIKVAPAPQPIEEPPPIVAPKPMEGDLASYVEARRRERGEPVASATQGSTASAQSAESDIERRNRIVAANLGLNRTPTFGYDPKNAGGIFQIEHLNYDYADFYYFGLNKDIGRNAKQLIEVRKGADSDIRITVIRKMIAIIRDNVAGDFVWLSRNGPITMSARPSDNAGLEDFIMRDVFPDARLPN
ncbi:MAG TPA: hypothetical protein VGL25_01525 [Casimicrobiaceae bacterium]|jgi:hypothetical protein